VALSAPVAAHAQAVVLDETCTTVRQVFFGMDDIAKKGNTKIIPFSKEYRSVLASYFERGCPITESFPLPKTDTDMQLAVTSGDVVVSGKIKFALGKPLLR
jgi:hypothetical protein